MGRKESEMDHMCDTCGQQEGVIRIAQSSGSKTKELWLCANCSRHYGVEPAQPPFAGGVREFVSGMIDRAIDEERPENPARCPTCATSLSSIRKTGQVGCADCYATFGDQIARLLSSLAVGIKHTGKYPARLLKHKRVYVDREQIRHDLGEAVRSEDYERAAQLRDSLDTIDREAGADDAYFS